MGIEDFKRWHWIAIAVVVGLALGYVWNNIESANLRNSGHEQFVRLLGQKDEKGKPIISRITIHPAEPNFEGKLINKVTYAKRMNRRDGKGQEVVREMFYAEVPFVPGRLEPGQQVDPNYTIGKFLDEFRKRDASIGYSGALLATRPASYALWTLGSIVTIGLLWPIVLNALIGAGYGRTRVEEKDDYFSRFSSHPEPEAKAAKPIVTQEEQDRVRALAERIEQNLAASGAGVTSAADGGAAPAEPVRKLDGGPLEVAPALLKPGEDDEIEVKGEYYPVLIHHKKQHGEDPERKQ
jgi:hypothetical protein